ncbi:LysR family transcriptional regulator [Tabrizicola piscis]|nr:LysR family transcriptional regulator [Tabrizicola piscis]
MNIRSSNWELFAAYLAVCRTSSLSAAARSLGLSQPTVRRQIEALEALVGTTLFTRSAAGLVPLEGHLSLMAEAEAMESAALAFARLASSSADDVSGTVRISCSNVYGVEILPPILAELQATWPKLEIELALTNDIANLLRRDADIAVRLARPEQAALVARKVSPMRLGFFAAPQLAERVRGMDFAALSATGLMISQDRLDTIAAGLRQLGLKPPTRTVFRSDDDLAQLAAIRSGIGVGICQIAIGQKSGLVRILEDLAPTFDAWVVMHEDQKRLARARVVFDALVKALDR